MGATSYEGPQAGAPCHCFGACRYPVLRLTGYYALRGKCYTSNVETGTESGLGVGREERKWD